MLLLEPATLLKVTLFRKCSLRFLNCTNSTKSRKESHILMAFQIMLVILVIMLMMLLPVVKVIGLLLCSNILSWLLYLNLTRYILVWV